MTRMSWLRSFLYRHCWRPKALWGQQKNETVTTGILILSKHPNPTFSYYLEERIAATGDLPVLVRDIDEPLEDINPKGLFVIVCRYIKPQQLRWLEAHRRHMVEVVYFVDDDIAAILAGSQARWRYKWKLLQTAIHPLLRLSPLLSQVWASTEGLRSTLDSGTSAIAVLSPYPPENGTAAETGPDSHQGLTMIYHATDIHRQEHAFLIPIVEAAMRRHEQLRFEVIADGEVASWWRSAAIDKHRISIKPALPWNDYLASTTRRPVDITLVPLLDGEINNARSDTKRIDIVRSGAAAIFSRCAIYQRCAMPAEVHVQNTQADWEDAIGALVQNPEFLSKAREATRESIALMRERAASQFPGLSFGSTAVRKRV